MRLDKLLGHMGIGTRSEVRKYAKYGWVEVDGKVVKISSVHVNPETQTILFKGEPVIYQEFVYFMMNKPPGVVSATEDARESTVIELLEDEHQGMSVFPVGRLDKDTEGLLLLTNHGALAHGLLSPKRHVFKIYEAIVDGPVTDADVQAFKTGVLLDDGYQTLPAELEIVSSEPHRSETRLTIYEGKFHQVKRMFETRGLTVIYLKRVSMGSLPLDESLEPGEYRALTREEVALLLEQAGLSES
jgi:16S rRNA pseudouridine516 synthase